jgi:hypothetical protein
VLVVSWVARPYEVSTEGRFEPRQGLRIELDVSGNGGQGYSLAEDIASLSLFCGARQRALP